MVKHTQTIHVSHNGVKSNKNSKAPLLTTAITTTKKPKKHKTTVKDKKKTCKTT